MKRTTEESIRKTEEILRKVTDNFYLAWQQRVKGTRFTLLGYMVSGQIFIVQLFDDGGIQHCMSCDSIRWDKTEELILKHFNKEVSPVS